MNTLCIARCIESHLQWVAEIRPAYHRSLHRKHGLVWTSTDNIIITVEVWSHPANSPALTPFDRHYTYKVQSNNLIHYLTYLIGYYNPFSHDYNLASAMLCVLSLSTSCGNLQFKVYSERQFLFWETSHDQFSLLAQFLSEGYERGSWLRNIFSYFVLFERP